MNDPHFLSRKGTERLKDGRTVDLIRMLCRLRLITVFFDVGKCWLESFGIYDVGFSLGENDKVVKSRVVKNIYSFNQLTCAGI